LQEGAAALIDHTQPAHAHAAAKAQLVDRIHLPDLVGLAGPLVVGIRPRSRRSGGELLLAEPAGQGALTGYGPVRVGSAEANANGASAPGGVLLTQGEGLPAERIVGPARPPRSGVIGRSQVTRILAEAVHEVLHGTQGQVQASGHLGRGETLAGEMPETLPQGQRKGGWHGVPRRRVQRSLVTIDRPPSNAKPFWQD
jgi:hypothetical protein